MATEKPNQHLVGQETFHVSVHHYEGQSRAILTTSVITKTWGADHVYTRADGRNEFRHAIQDLHFTKAAAWRAQLDQDQAAVDAAVARLARMKNEQAATIKLATEAGFDPTLGGFMAEGGKQK